MKSEENLLYSSGQEGRWWGQKQRKREEKKIVYTTGSISSS